MFVADPCKNKRRPQQACAHCYRTGVFEKPFLHAKQETDQRYLELARRNLSGCTFQIKQSPQSSFQPAVALVG
jgi:hypothetical protein